MQDRQDRQDKDNRRSRGPDEKAQSPECASPSKKAKQAIGETKSETSISPAPDSTTPRKATPRLTPRILSEEFSPPLQPPIPLQPLPFSPGFDATLSPLTQVNSPLYSHTSLTQELENISIPAPVENLNDYVLMTQLNKALYRKDRTIKGYTPLSYNDMLPGSQGVLSSIIAPHENISVGVTEEQQKKPLNQLSAMYANQLKNYRQMFVLLAKDDQLFLDPYICTVMPDFRTAGSRVAGNFLDAKPQPAKDGMYAYVVVKTNGIYELRLFATSNGQTNHSGLFGSSDERFAVGEIYIKNGKVVMMNDKTGSSHRDVLSNSAKLRLTESSHKLAMEAFIPASCRTASALYNWNQESIEVISDRIAREVMLRPLQLVLVFFERNTNLFTNKNEVERTPIITNIYSRMLEGLLDLARREKFGCNDGHVQIMALQLFNQLFQDYGLTLQHQFALPDVIEPIKIALRALTNVEKYHARYNDICLHNKLVALGFTKADKVQPRVNEIPVELAFMPTPLEFPGTTPVASPLISMSHFLSSTSSVSSSSSDSPLLPPGAEQETPRP